MQDYDIAVSDLRHVKHNQLNQYLNTERFAKLPRSFVESTPNAVITFDIVKVKLVSRLSSKYKRFEEFCSSIANGISTGANDVYIVSNDLVEKLGFENDVTKPTLRGGDFIRFHCPTSTEESILYVTKIFKADTAPHIYEYLSSYRDFLIQKSVEKRKGIRPWWLLFRAREEDMFLSPKIVFRQTSDKIVAAIDYTQSYYAIDSVNIANLHTIYNESQKYFLGILNSNVLHFFYREISQESGRVLAQVKPQRLRMLPIAWGNIEEEKKISKIVDNIENALATGNHGEQVAVWECELNALVYALYDLTPDEIALIEAQVGSTANSSAELPDDDVNEDNDL